MLESQLIPNRIGNPELLAAMGALERERFLPPLLHGVAYVDEDIELGQGRFLMEPLVLARLVELLAPAKDEDALEIGAGTGYGTAVLARLCHSVVGLEADARLASDAAATLRDLGVRNAIVTGGALERGYSARAPYDLILIGGAVEAVPDAILDQLGEGGRLATVIRAPGKVGRTTLIARRGGLLETRQLHDAATLPLPGFARPRAFSF
ncbi:MAG TPA: protein-L-isoaspartate O-methyltransferase [Alphaproteobacteria bacterium]|nr:protein-L-isoaspartate O-methyltransferase [Alphaproteobacteria bacterium]